MMTNKKNVQRGCLDAGINCMVNLFFDRLHYLNREYSYEV